jgi:hypothetical protein
VPVALGKVYVYVPLPIVLPKLTLFVVLLIEIALVNKPAF